MLPEKKTKHSNCQFPEQSKSDYMPPDISIEDLHIDASLLDSGSMKTSDWDVESW
jgi:hypothetical protein